MKILETQLLRPSQVSQIVALDRICLGGLWTAEGYLREIDSPNSSLLVLNLSDRNSTKSNSIMVGMACLWSIVEEAHITLLAIHPDYRQQGFGTLLLLSLLNNAIARKLEWATLEVNVNNFSAINLYKKFGFEVVGKRRKYYSSTGDDASILWLKKLQQPDFKTALIQWQQSLATDLSENNYYWHKS
ncbi:GNAT family N-acetyltransferase [Waterburya agarophytonicola K14]|uniref:GNAT family N-acetyltransferase n=1 Tax=Waterburya agarophytonicola KI4 TaxID=2874699 RepID=A0A964FHU5_9CYAN|nr:GNAT family N-acetyltransferase [Waterburya agarophytonicola KI4]